MKISCHLSAWGKDFEKGLHDIATLGFRAFESGSNVIFKYESRLEEFTALIQSLELVVSAIFEVGHFNMWSQRREIYVHHDRLGRLLQRLKVDSVVIGPGIRLGKVNDPDYEQHMLQMIREVARRYQFYGIDMGIHPHFGSNIFSESEIDFVMTHTLQAIKLVPDIGHAVEAGINFSGLIERYMTRIMNVHIKDIVISDTVFSSIKNGGNHKIGKFCELGQGQMNFVPMFELMRSNQYSGWLTAELETPCASPFVSMRMCKQYLNNISHLH